MTPAPQRSATHLPDWASDAICIAVVVLTLAFPDRGPMGPGPHDADAFVSAIALVPVVVAAAALPLRRRRPIAVTIGCLIVYGVTAFIGPASLGAGIAVVIAAYSMASRRLRRFSFAVGGLGALSVAILSVTAADFGVVDPRIFQVAAAIAVATALGDSARSRREYLRAVEERAERAERTREAEAHRLVAEERLRIAQDLHDTVAHRISVISLNAGVASGALEKRPEKARASLATIREASRGVLSDIGELLRYLRDDNNAVEAPQPGLAELRVALQTTGDPSRASGAIDRVAYRVVQEGLTNAHKHGEKHSASVELDLTGDVLIIEVVNPAAASGADLPGGGLGLVGMRERVAAVRGSVSSGREGDVFRLHARLPLTKGFAG
jgi:signal transduction histidine kinase